MSEEKESERGKGVKEETNKGEEEHEGETDVVSETEEEEGVEFGHCKL